MTMMLMKTLMMLSRSSPKFALPVCLANANTANEYFYELVKKQNSINAFKSAYDAWKGKQNKTNKTFINGFKHWSSLSRNGYGSQREKFEILKKVNSY